MKMTGMTNVRNMYAMQASTMLCHTPAVKILNRRHGESSSSSDVDKLTNAMGKNHKKSITPQCNNGTPEKIQFTLQLDSDVMLFCLVLCLLSRVIE